MNKNINSMCCYCLNCLKLLVHSLSLRHTAFLLFLSLPPLSENDSLRRRGWKQVTWDTYSFCVVHFTTPCHVILHSFISRPTRPSITWQEWWASGCAAPHLSCSRSCSWAPARPWVCWFSVSAWCSREKPGRRNLFICSGTKHAGYHTFINYFCSSVPVSVCCSAERG